MSEAIAATIDLRSDQAQAPNTIFLVIQQGQDEVVAGMSFTAAKEIAHSILTHVATHTPSNKKDPIPLRAKKGKTK